MSSVVEDLLAMAIPANFMDDGSTSSALVAPKLPSASESSINNRDLRLLCLGKHPWEYLLLDNLDSGSATPRAGVDVSIRGCSRSSTVIAEHLLLYHELRKTLSITSGKLTIGPLTSMLLPVYLNRARNKQSRKVLPWHVDQLTYLLTKPRTPIASQAPVVLVVGGLCVGSFSMATRMPYKRRTHHHHHRRNLRTCRKDCGVAVHPRAVSTLPLTPVSMLEAETISMDTNLSMAVVYLTFLSTCSLEKEG